MPRFVPTLPQWPCSDCRKLLTRHRAYCWVQCGTMYGIQRKVNGAYCRGCARTEAQAQEAAAHHTIVATT